MAKTTKGKPILSPKEAENVWRDTSLIHMNIRRGYCMSTAPWDLQDSVLTATLYKNSFSLLWSRFLFWSTWWGWQGKNGRRRGGGLNPEDVEKCIEQSCCFFLALRSAVWGKSFWIINIVINNRLESEPYDSHSSLIQWESQCNKFWWPVFLPC